MVRMYENTDVLPNARVYTLILSKGSSPLYGRVCGLVKLVVMNIHVSLQAVRFCRIRHRLRGRT